jgi:hypothetical protein
MKKLFLIVLIGLSIWGLITWVDFSQHSNWYYAGLIIGGILALAVVTVMIKIIFRFVKWMFTSCLYLSLVTATLVILTNTSVIPVLAGTVSCIVSGGLLTVMIIRRIASKTQTSSFCDNLFTWVTGYRVHTVQSVKEKVASKPTASKATIENPDRENLEEVLKVMGFSYTEIKESSDYAIEQKPDASLEDKVKCALEYINSNKLLKGIK